MKKIARNVLIADIIICAFLAGCNSSRTFEYQFNDANKAVIRNVLSHGKISCENCYLNGACVQVVDSIVTDDKYELTGKCALYSYHVTTESLTGGTKMKIMVKSSLIVGRNKTSEKYLLEEIGVALFEANYDYIRHQLKDNEDKEK